MAAMKAESKAETGVTTKMLIWGVVGVGGMTTTAVVILAIYGGVNSVAATNTLLSIMGPLLTGLVTALIVRVNIIHKQFDGLKDQVVEFAEGKARSEGAAAEAKISAETAKVVAKEGAETAKVVAKEGAETAAAAEVARAEVAAEKAAVDVAAAEKRAPQDGDGSQ